MVFLLSFLLELLKKCRYDEGYIVQDVYACKTCYLEGTGRDVTDFEKIVSDPNHALKEHGICVGCIF